MPTLPFGIHQAYREMDEAGGESAGKESVACKAMT